MGLFSKRKNTDSKIEGIKKVTDAINQLNKNFAAKVGLSLPPEEIIKVYRCPKGCVDAIVSNEARPIPHCPQCGTQAVI